MQTLYLQVKITVALSGLNNSQNFRLTAVKENKIFIHYQNYLNETTTILNILYH